MRFVRNNELLLHCNSKTINTSLEENVMAPIRRYLKLTKNSVVAVQIFLDQDLLLSLVQKVRNAYDGGETDSISELSLSSLPNKDINKFLETLSPHLIRVFSSAENDSYSAHEFFNLKSTFSGKVLKRDSDVMNYRLHENGWKATVKITRPQDQFFPTYSDEQLLERKVSLNETIDIEEHSAQVGEEEDEKPLNLKKQLVVKYHRLFLAEDQKVIVYIQERPAKA